MTTKTKPLTKFPDFPDFSLFPQELQKDILANLPDLPKKQANQLKKLLKSIIKAGIDLKTLNSFEGVWYDDNEISFEISGEERLSTGETSIEQFTFCDTTFSTPIYCSNDGEISTYYENVQAKPTFDCDPNDTHDGIMTWERFNKLKVFK